MSDRATIPDAEVEAAPPRRSWVAPMVCAVIAFAASVLGSYFAFSQPAPFGVPIPPPPPPYFTVKTGIDFHPSYKQRVLPEAYVFRLAPQPDGLPALRNVYDNERLDFSIKYPYGTENVQFPGEQLRADAIDSQALVKLEQPLAAIKISLPARKDKQTTLNYAQQLLADLQEGAQVLEQPKPVQLPGGGFITEAYLRETSDGRYVHRLYLTGFGKRVLVLDLMLRPEQQQEGEQYAFKVMRSFKPGPTLTGLLDDPPKKQDKPQRALPQSRLE